MKIRDIPDIEELDPFDLLAEVVEREGITDIVLEPSHVYLRLEGGEFFVGLKNNKLLIQSIRGDWFEASWSFSEIREAQIRPDGKAISILTKDGMHIRFFLDSNLEVELA